MVETTPLAESKSAMRYVEHGLELGWDERELTEEIRAVMEGYNSEDCFSTAEMRDWLEEQRKKLKDSGTTVARFVDRPEDPNEKVDERQKRLAPLIAKLTEGVSADPQLRTKTQAGEIPPFVVVQTQQRVRDAITLFHEHRVSQLPVMDGEELVGSVGERGLLKRAMNDPQLMSAGIAAVMEAPFPSVATSDPVREAVELLTGEGQALIVTDHGRPVGIVTRTDLLESLVS